MSNRAHSGALTFASGRKPKNARAKRVLTAQQPKVFEEERAAIFMRGTTANEAVTGVLRDLYMLKKPNAKFFDRKNPKRPFEDDTSVEFLCVKNEASLFAFGSHTKKRPCQVTIGRLFDAHILDMFELAVTNVKLMKDFPTSKCMLGSKPCMVFQGEDFELKEDFVHLKSMLLDFFSSRAVEKTNLSGLDHVIVCTAVDGTVMLRHYKVGLKKSGIRTPLVELTEIGPRLDFTLNRKKLADASLRREAMRLPRQLEKGKTKNIDHNNMGDTMGRIHMEKQDLDSLQLRKVKALKRSRDLPPLEGEGVEGAGGAAAAAEPEPAAPNPRSKRSRKDD